MSRFPSARPILHDLIRKTGIHVVITGDNQLTAFCRSGGIKQAGFRIEMPACLFHFIKDFLQNVLSNGNQPKTAFRSSSQSSWPHHILRALHLRFRRQNFHIHIRSAAFTCSPSFRVRTFLFPAFYNTENCFRYLVSAYHTAFLSAIFFPDG